MAPEHGPLVFLIAGEVSADMIGARVMAGLRKRLGDGVRFAGIGGARMAAAGLDSLYPMDEFSLVGLTEVVPHIPRILKRMGQVATTIRDLGPDLVLCIDTSGFSRGVARRIDGSDIPIVQYKAPQAWAYAPWRARKMARYFDHVLAILPFEPDFFAAYGVRCSFIGHPAVESGVLEADGARFRKRHAIRGGAPMLVALPGSRSSEIQWSLALFGKTLELVAARVDGLHVVLPTVESVADRVREAIASWPVPALLVEGDADRFDALAAADAALTVTGTITAELALAGVPMVACYRGSWLTALIARRLVTVDHFSIPNLVLDRSAVPELLQGECAPRPLADACVRLLSDMAARTEQRDHLHQAAALLGAGAKPPSERAVDLVVEMLTQGPAKRRRS